MSYVVQMTPGHVLPTRALRERIRQEVGEPSGLSTNPFADQIQDSLRTERFQTVLFATFAVIALVSAAVGLYGVCAFEVASRRREFGIRLALGGTPRDLRRLVLRQTLAPAFAGVGADLALSYWAAKFLQSFLHQVDARDPWTLALVAGVLIVTAGTASWLPARRASGVDLANILRSM
jgi:ABC-type antimicrobial peptide transport system permease subunit